MTKDQITAWAREAGFDTDLPGFRDGSAIALKLAALAYAAGAAEEREACAKVCDATANNPNEWAYERCTAEELAAAIRARS